MRRAFESLGTRIRHSTGVSFLSLILVLWWNYFAVLTGCLNHTSTTTTVPTTKQGNNTVSSSPSISSSPAVRPSWQGPPCNQVITTVSVHEIRAIAQAWVDIVAPSTLYTNAEREAALNVYLGNSINNSDSDNGDDDDDNLAYDLLVSKVCGSCQQRQQSKSNFHDDIHHDNNHSSASNENDKYPYYCSPQVFGYNVTHSALVFHPIHAQTGQPLTGSLPVGVGFQGTRFYINEAFSTDFPTNVTERLIQATSAGGGGNLAMLSTSFVDVFPLLVAASKGMITYGPDFLGGGESSVSSTSTAGGGNSAGATVHRSYLTALPIQQAAVTSYYATAAYTQNLTQGKTTLSPQRVLVWGYSAGGGAAVWATHALQQEGLHVQRTFTQAGVYSLPAMVQALLDPILADPFHTDIGFDAAGFWALFAASYSDEVSFLPNTGTGQTLLSPSFRDPTNPSQNVLEWVFGQKSTTNSNNPLDALQADVRTRYPKTGQNFLDSVNRAIFAPIGTSARVFSFFHSQSSWSSSAPPTLVSAKSFLFCDTPFVTSETFALCKALRDNSPVSILHLIDNPMEWCHSPHDRTVPFFSTGLYLLGRQNHNASNTTPAVQPYEPTFAFMKPKGSHGLAQILCSAAVPTYLAKHPALVQATPTTQRPEQ